MVPKFDKDLCYVCQTMLTPKEYVLHLVRNKDGEVTIATCVKENCIKVANDYHDAVWEFEWLKHEYEELYNLLNE